MGVEYRHFLVPADITWLPQFDTASRIESVLRSWSLITGEAEAFDLTGNRQTPIPVASALSRPLGPGLALLYPGVDGPAVSRVLGPSHFPEVDEADRYIQAITMVVGLDIRVHSSSEALCFSVTTPPLGSSGPIDPYPTESDLYVYAEAYPASASTLPPSVTVDVNNRDRRHLAWKQHPGCWRAALILDCGKDLPSFVSGLHTIPSLAFLQQLAEAFRCDLRECGEFY